MRTRRRYRSRAPGVPVPISKNPKALTFSIFHSSGAVFAGVVDKRYGYINVTVFRDTSTRIAPRRKHAQARDKKYKMLHVKYKIYSIIHKI